MAVVEVKDLTFRYKNRFIFDKFNLSVERGCWVTIAGSNGSGKTTLVKLLAGLLKSYSSIEILNKPLDKKNIYNVDFISYTYVNQIEYQFIINSLNNTKSKIALNNYNISDDDINMVYQKVDVKRQIISNENNDEISNSIIMLLSIIISLPTLILIIFLIQMIGSEINEEKSTKSMEIIIGNI